jgi:hypothetical protein
MLPRCPAVTGRKKDAMTAQKDNPHLTITLTGRNPVKIKKDDWPIIADAEDYWYDGQVEFQANRRKKCKLVVRQHADGRTLVYGIYTYQTNFQSERGYDVRGGELLTVDGVSSENVGDCKVIAGAIQRVGQWMIEHLPSDRQDDDEAFDRVIHDCIADLPAEEL